MPKLAIIDCPIDYHEGTCFNRGKLNPCSNQWPLCEWHQGLGNTFPADCPLKDAPEEDTSDPIRVLYE